MRICNTLNDLSNRVCVPNKTEDLNLNVFNMITRTNEWKILTKHISCRRKCKFDGSKCNSDQKRSNDKCWCEYKNSKTHQVCKRNYIEILLQVVVKMVDIQEALLTIQ